MDNYQQVTRRWQDMARNWNYAERYEALGLPGYVPSGPLPIEYFGKMYLLDRKDGTLREKVSGCAADFSTAMAIYGLFYYSEKQPRAAGRWLPFRQVPMVAQFEPAFLKQWVQPFSRAFNGRLDLLKQAGEKLGFLPLPQSDAGFQAQVFHGLPIRYLFWDGDEEFPANTTVLFDANITRFVHPELVVTIGCGGLTRLLQAAGLDTAGFL